MFRDDLHDRGVASKGAGQIPSTTGYGQRVGGTHPTGMHSCYKISIVQHQF